VSFEPFSSPRTRFFPLIVCESIFFLPLLFFGLYQITIVFPLKPSAPWFRTPGSTTLFPISFFLFKPPFSLWNTNAPFPSCRLALVSHSRNLSPPTKPLHGLSWCFHFPMLMSSSRARPPAVSSEFWVKFGRCIFLTQP